MSHIHEIYIIMIAGGVTALLRFLPFIAFRTKRPAFVLYLGRVLPYSVMAMLVVYCLRSSHGLPEFTACMAVIILHVWKRNTLLSITAGTILYMCIVSSV